MVDSQSLDAKYLQFLSATQSVFDTFPVLTGLRHAIFKTLLIRRVPARPSDWFRHCLRPFGHRPSRPRSRVPQPDVLLLVESRREVVEQTLLPIHEELERRHHRSVLLTSTAGVEFSSAELLRFSYRPRFMAPPWTSDAWNALCSCVPELRAGGLTAHFRILTAVQQAFYDALFQTVQRISPRVVVILSTSIRGGATLATIARQQGIPSVLLQHGIPEASYLPLLADLTLLWGPTSLDVLNTLGADPGGLRITGSPRHDHIPHQVRGATSESLRKRLALPSLPTLVFFSNGNDLLRNGPAPAQCATWLINAALKFRGQANIVVRLHPNEDGSLYAAAQHLTVFRDEVDLVQTLQGCDVAASLCSTVLYEALLLRRPVWQFFAEGWPKLARNWEQGLAWRVTSEEELQRTLRLLVDRADIPGRPTQETTARVFANQGHAVAAVANQLETLLT